MSDNAINPQKSGWFGRMRARLVAVPPRVWWSLLAASLALHIVAVGVVLVLLFGGERGGGAEADSIVISAGEAGPEELDLVLPQDNQVELPRLAEAELDLSELLEVPLEADFNDLMMDNAQMATIAPAMPMPSAAVTQRALPGGGLISGVPKTLAILSSICKKPALMSFSPLMQQAQWSGCIAQCANAWRSLRNMCAGWCRWRASALLLIAIIMTLILSPASRNPVSIFKKPAAL